MKYITASVALCVLGIVCLIAGQPVQSTVCAVGSIILSSLSRENRR